VGFWIAFTVFTFMVLIVLAGTVAGAATSFVASLPIPLGIKAPAAALATTVTGAILLYWKSKVNKK
jgi:hypothetical protein